MSDDSPGALTGAASGGDWPAQAADTIVRVVGQVRDKTTGPAITATRYVVYGLLAGLLGGVCALLLAIMGVRLLDAYLPDAVVGERHTWTAHLLLGLVFTAVGLFLWTKRRAPDDAE